MNCYQAATPRAAILIAAVVMTALTLGLSILPAKVNSGGNVGSFANGSRVFGPSASALPGEGMPIVVYGVREQETAMRKVQVPHVGPPRKQKLIAAFFLVTRTPRRATGSVKGRARCVRPFVFPGSELVRWPRRPVGRPEPAGVDDRQGRRSGGRAPCGLRTCGQRRNPLDGNSHRGAGPFEGPPRSRDPSQRAGRAAARHARQPDSPGRFLRQSTSGVPAARFRARASTNKRSESRLT